MTGNTALISAVEAGNVRVVPTLCAAGARVDKRGTHGTTALIVACKRGDATLARFLLDHGADPTLHDSLGTNCVSACIMSDASAEILKMIIETKKINWDCSPVSSPLSKKISSSKHQNQNQNQQDLELPQPHVMANSALGVALGTAAVQQMMNSALQIRNKINQANPVPLAASSTTPSAKGPPLLEACRLGASEQVVKMILSAGANPNAAEPSNGVTALLMAVKTGRTDLAKILVAAGADVNKSSSNLITPLMSACVTGDVESARFLISKGAHLNVRDHNGNSALQLAKNYNCPDLADLLKKSGATE